MRAIRPVVLATVLASSLTLALPTTVAAQDDPPVIDVGELENGNPAISSTRGDSSLTIDVTAAREGTGETVSAPGAPGWLDSCFAEPITGAELTDLYEQGFGATANRPQPTSADEEWIGLFCVGYFEENPAAGLNLTGLLSVWLPGEQPPQIAIDVIVAQARAGIELPIQTGQGAPFGDDDAPLITQLPTWLWIDDAVWAPQSATTPAVFGFSVTATATPANVTFTNNNGDTINCGANTGPAYNFNLDDTQQASDCTLTYQHSSAVTDHTLTTTITWNVTYTCTAFCGPGTLPGFTITTTRNVQVAELQALLINDPAANQGPTGPEGG